MPVQRLAHHLQAHVVAALQVGHERLVPLVRVAGKVRVLDSVLCPARLSLRGACATSVHAGLRLILDPCL